MLKRTREYDKDDYSVPIGSRYHPERAAIWEPNSPVGDDRAMAGGTVIYFVNHYQYDGNTPET